MNNVHYKCGHLDVVHTDWSSNWEDTLVVCDICAKGMIISRGHPAAHTYKPDNIAYLLARHHG